MSRSGMLDLDLGLDDDDDPSPRRPRGRGVESTQDLLSGSRDLTMLGGGAGTRRRARGSGFFGASGGSDPLDALKAHVTQQHQATSAEQEAEAEAQRQFELEMQAALGVAGLSTAAAAGSRGPPAHASRGRTPAHSGEPSEGGGSDLNDLLDNIEGNMSGSAAARQPRPARGTPLDDDSGAPSRSRTPPVDDEFERAYGGPPRSRAAQAEDVSPGRPPIPGGRRARPSVLGDSASGLANLSAVRQGSNAPSEAEGSLGGPDASPGTGFFGSDAGGAPFGGGTPGPSASAFSVELDDSRLRRRTIGKPKAKAKAAPEPSPASSLPAAAAQPEPAAAEPAAHRAPEPAARAPAAAPTASAMYDDDDDEDDGELLDLPMGDSSGPAARLAQAGPAAALSAPPARPPPAEPAAAAGEDAELPEFLLGGARERRPRRGEATPPGSSAPGTASSQAAAALAADDDVALPDFLRGGGARERRGARVTPPAAATPSSAQGRSPAATASEATSRRVGLPAASVSAGMDLGFTAEDMDASDKSLSAEAAPSALGLGGRAVPAAAVVASAASASASLSAAGVPQATTESGALEVELRRPSPRRRLGRSRTPPPDGSEAPDQSASGPRLGAGVPPASPSGGGLAALAAELGGRPPPRGVPPASASSARSGADSAAPPGAHFGGNVGGDAPAARGVPPHPGVGIAREYQPSDVPRGVPPGSPPVSSAPWGGAPPSDAGQAARDALAAAAAPTRAAAATGWGAGGSRASAGHGPAGSPVSERPPSLFGDQALPAGPELVGGLPTLSAFPPGAAPPGDQLAKLAHAEAKVRALEAQLEAYDERWQQRLVDAKQQSNEEVERKELQCRRLEAELDRCKDIHSADLRRLGDAKQLLIQGHEAEKDDLRREERRRAQLELERVRADHAVEVQELQHRHERALAIAQQQADLEAENYRRAQGGEQQLSRLVEQVQSSVIDVERMGKRLEADKGLERGARERQLEEREKRTRELEMRLSSETREVEEQRRRVSELVRRMEDSQLEDKAAAAAERERLEAEHRRLLELQQAVRDSDRSSKEALKHAWAQLEDGRRALQQERLAFEGDASARKEEADVQDRHLRQEAERLQMLHQQVEVARQNASRRIRETEATIAGERRSLMTDLEVYEEKRVALAEEAARLAADRAALEGARASFEDEVKKVGSMASEMQRRSEEVRALHDQTALAYAEVQRLRGALQEERLAQGSEMERLKTLQQMIEQQRLQLLQTENQLCVRGIEDIDMMVTTSATFPADCGPGGAADIAHPEQSCAPAVWQPGGFPGSSAQEGGYHASTPPPQAAAPRRVTPPPVAPTPCRAGAAPWPPACGSGSRVELQTLLHRTREESGKLQLFIQEQYRFLRHEVTSAASERVSAAAGGPLGAMGQPAASWGRGDAAGFRALGLQGEGTSGGGSIDEVEHAPAPWLPARLGAASELDGTSGSTA